MVQTRTNDMNIQRSSHSIDNTILHDYSAIQLQHLTVKIVFSHFMSTVLMKQ